MYLDPKKQRRMDVHWVDLDSQDAERPVVPTQGVGGRPFTLKPRTPHLRKRERLSPHFPKAPGSHSADP